MCSKTMTAGNRTILQPTTDISSRGGCHKASDSYSSGLTQQLPAFYKLKKKKNRIKNPEAQIRGKKQPEESKRQLVTISGTADEVTTDTEGKKMKT